MLLVDTHCHIHDPEFASSYKKTIAEIIAEAAHAGVRKFICVGTDAQSSTLAVAFTDDHKNSYASIALHPHEVSIQTKQQLATSFNSLQSLLTADPTKIVAIGECGLDYYYHKETDVQKAQQDLFRKHLDLAILYKKPLIFHIRDAFDDFFAILDEYAATGKQIKGVVHSFSAHIEQLNGCIERGLYVGLNGIMTFTKDQKQLEAAKAAPLNRIVLETDAPFLTPKPFRGTMCELKHVVLTAEFLSDLRGESLETFAEVTTANAFSLFSL